MHTANEVQDALWMIRQDTETKWCVLYYCGEVVGSGPEDRLLSFDELRNLLITMRNEYSEIGGNENE